MNENKEIDNSPIKIAQWVGAKAQGEKMRWITITKTVVGIIFQFTKFSFIDFVLPTEEIFKVNGHIDA